MKRVLIITILFLTLAGCKRKSDFVIFQKHFDGGAQTLFIYTNATDSLEILEYSLALAEKLNPGKSYNQQDYMFIFYCHDSGKYPGYYKGKMDDNKHTSFASFSNMHEKFYRENKPGALYFDKEYPGYKK